jgi:glycosyltransferase involved in cell wall biosynthesis
MNSDYIRIIMLSPRAPAVGGISTWTEEFIKMHENSNICTEIVNTVKNTSSLKSRWRSRFDEMIRSFKILFNELKSIIKTKPHIVHINSSCSKTGVFRDLIAVIIARIFKVRVVFYCHCTISDQLGNGRIPNLIFKLICIYSHQILVLNNKSYGLVNKYMDSIQLVPNYVSLETVTKSKTINQRLKKIVYTGRIVKNKGIYELLEVAKSCPDIGFTLLGPISEEFRGVKVPNNVEMLGPVSNNEIIKYLDEADVFLLLSHSEGFSYSLLEAMSRGLPIITTNVGANEDMIESQGGVIVEYLTTENVIKAIDSIRGFETRKRMSLWNINKVSMRYTTESVISVIDNIYYSIIHDRRV